jgi:hypothetical protein
LSYLAIIRNGVPNFLDIWIAVIAAIILASLTYRYVEMPLRRRSGVVATLSSGMALIGAIGIVTIVAAGFDFRFPPEIQEIANIRAQDNAGFRDKCFLEQPGSGFSEACIEKVDKPLVFLWGDSTAAALYPGLKDAESKKESFRLARFSAPGCAPILDAGSNSRCDEANRIAFGFIAASHPDVVLLHAMWGDTNDLGKLHGTIERLKQNKIPRIVLIGPVPIWKRTLPQAIVNYYRLRHQIPDRIAAGVSGPEGDDRMKAFSQAEAVEYISAWHALCNAEGCLTHAGPVASDAMVTDIIHLSDAGSRFLIGALKKELLPP